MSVPCPSNPLQPRRPPTLVDIGANLTHHSLHPTLPILTEAYNAGVQHIIITGTSVNESAKAIELCRRFAPGGKDFCVGENGRRLLPSLYCTVGIHPHEAGRAVEHSGAVDTKKALLDLIQKNRDIVVAVGECGLDYNRNFSSHHDQDSILTLQLDIARELNMPLFLHERDAFDPFVAILERTPSSFHTSHPWPSLRGVVHCFTSGNPTHLARYLSLGFHIGITGWVSDTQRGANLQSVMGTIPLDRLMIETDAPFLIPRNAPKSARRGKSGGINKPHLLTYVAEKVAECYGIGLAEIAKHTTNNAAELFGLDGVEELDYEQLNFDSFKIENSEL
ncbi:hypothetical protein HK104_001667 [Borealophlyctis nickersoniae]|nr:hypothetical protein HK104_001667 [Borealophlyctis nickersoniae]